MGKNIGYYRQKQVIRLAPEFEVNLNGTVTYEFTAHDDTLSKNVATQSALSSGLDSKRQTISVKPYSVKDDKDSN